MDIKLEASKNKFWTTKNNDSGFCNHLCGTRFKEVFIILS